MFCPKCGVDNADTNKFCRKCGKQLPDRSQIQHAATQGYTSGQMPGFVGQVIDGKYRIDARLGSGGMGDVYQATRLLIGDTVAIKILHSHLAYDPQAAERFRREAVTATRLRHRNVVAIYDVGISAAHNVPYILMEQAEGYTLRQIINKYRVLPLDFAVTVTTQVCSALDEAHGLGIVHRDIKPENIVANETTTGWSVKVLDFGIAKLYNQADIGLTQDGSAMGTPQYMSPEQCMGEPLDARSDIYSVGIMLYEMLCGTVPFKAMAASAIAIHQVQTKPLPPSHHNTDIPPEVEAVIMRALEKLPQARPARASQLAQDLIKAATIAFKSGHSTVSHAPIAAPDIEPEFTAVDESPPADEAAENLKNPTPPEEIVAAEPLPIIEGPSIDEKDKTLNLKDLEPVAVSDGVTVDTEKSSDSNETEIDRPVELPSGKIESTETMPVDKRSKSKGRKTTAFRANKTIARLAKIPHEEPDDVAAPFATELPQIDTATPASNIDGHDGLHENHLVELNQVFEDAELLLDEILVDTQRLQSKPPDAAAIAAESREEQENSAPSLPVLKSPISDVSLTEESGGPHIESSETPILSILEAKSGRKPNIKFYVIGAAVVVMLSGMALVVAAAAWFYFGKGVGDETESKPSTISPASPSGTSTATPPVGMAFVPGGEFIMGSEKGDEYSRPPHKITVKPFFMDITEVTNEEYKKFVDATSHKPPPDWQNGTFGEGKARFPVTSVSWDDATAYAKWAEKRLPTEEEWEFAARGTDGRTYPWGNDWKPELANADKQSTEMREVGQGGKSPFGMYDMSGNAFEWTASDSLPYPGGRKYDSRTKKIIRGGYWGSRPENATTFGRPAYGATGEKDGYPNMGIRCVKDN